VSIWHTSTESICDVVNRQSTDYQYSQNVNLQQQTRQMALVGDNRLPTE